MNIVIIGTGGVGGYFGGKIAEYCQGSEEYKVYFVARGEHLKKIKENGLQVNTITDGTFICRPYMVTDNFEDLPVIDICFIAVKGYDLDDVLNKIKSKINDNSEIIPLLNGVDIAQRVRKVIKKGILYPACVYVGTHIEKPGVISQNGGSCTIKFGNEKSNDKLNEFNVEDKMIKENIDCDESSISKSGERICDILSKSKINFDYTSRNYEEIWSKYMFIASYGLVTACYNKTLGEIYEDSELSSKVLSIMNAIKSLAEKENVDLPKNIVKSSYDKAKAFPYETKTSFQRDYEKDTGRDERDVFGKAIIDMANKYNVDCQCVRNIYKRL
ncbi:ketopantoate reductase family protein [uncultured Clostridium sp.]|uniref:ketopantoate reductase family protein n=1 Tax=uncultured Clostridium sp. TaxID=59620 RepID=UPI0025E838FA|nr:2-dehydropantoate 2-reductase [uncultured Clostridium sp.]